MDFQDFDKIRASLRYWFLGRDYFNALKAMEIGLEYHTGTRKNGAPEYIHQISQMQYARTLERHLLYPEDTFCTIALHDIVEDHKYPRSSIKPFGDRVYRAVELMTDADESGEDKNLADYFRAMGFDPIASFCKGVDRMHNYQTMMQIFKVEKKQRYLAEGVDHILPMLKIARKQFPEQEQAYHNVSHILRMQIELIQYSLKLEPAPLIS
jgi:(p)ppGpp synthase/HD superfamily hydrolase